MNEDHSDVEQHRELESNAHNQMQSQNIPFSFRNMHVDLKPKKKNLKERKTSKALVDIRNEQSKLEFIIAQRT